MNDDEKQTLRALYEKYGYAGVRCWLDEWLDKEDAVPSEPRPNRVW